MMESGCEVSSKRGAAGEKHACSRRRWLRKDHPILAQIIPIRRCNLACTYCNEYDKTSPPVPTQEMLRRIDKLGELGTTIITFSGGEPMLHPDLDRLITRVRDRAPWPL